MKHLSVEDMRKLSIAYLSDKLLDDEELQIKRHMASCDSCYENFCAEYLILKTLDEKGLIDKNTIAIQEAVINDNVILSISLIQEKGKKLLLDLGQKFADSLLWQFSPENTLAFARGNEEEERYISAELEDSCVRIANNVLYIELEEKFFEERKISLLILDGDRQETREFSYDEDIEMFVIEVDMTEWTENVVLSLLEESNS